MTTFDGDPSAGDAVDLRETDEATEAADEAAETTEDTAESAETQGEPAEEVDPAAALKAELRSKPGDWYVIHSYAGYENKVKANLETRVQNLDVGDYIFQVEVPTEEVTEIKNGQRKQVNRKVLPGYILVRMDLTDDSWAAVRNTPGVTGFVGATSRPSALSLDDVVKFTAAARRDEEGRQGCGQHRGRRRGGRPGASGHRGRLRGGRVGDGDGRTVRHPAGHHQRGQRRAAEAQGAGVHLRPRNAGGTDLQPSLQALNRRRRRAQTRKDNNISWPRRRKSSG